MVSHIVINGAGQFLHTGKHTAAQSIFTDVGLPVRFVTGTHHSVKYWWDWYLCTLACLAELKKSATAGRNPQVLTMSPPLSMQTHWFQNHTAYSMAKYGMSLCTLGHAGEFKKYGIGVNSLWPRTAIATAPMQMIPGVDMGLCHKPEILSDAAWLILTNSNVNTGNFYIDDTVFAAHGITDRKSTL